MAGATSSLIVLVSSTGSLVSYAASGRLNVQYSAIIAGACFPCAAAGTFLISRAVRRSGRASVLVLLLACTIGLGAAITIAFEGRQAVEALADGTDIGFDELCPA